MRSFSDTEKRILRFMAYPPMPQDICIISLFENFSDCYLIGWPEDCSSLELVHSQDKDWKDVRAKIFDIIVLLQYLESNQYIGVFQLNLLKDNQIYNRKMFDVERDGKGNLLMWAKDTCKLNIKIPNDKGTGLVFEPGPFTRILEKALRGKENKIHYYLIIEEMNRGNAQAILGDIFQLLDRDEYGNSKYKITNYVIAEYLKEKKVTTYSEKIGIPSNLSIIATINTSDQNVFNLELKELHGMN